MTDSIDAIKTDETLPDLSKKDVQQAKKEGALEAVKEGAKQRFKSTDGIGVTEETNAGPQATYDIFHLQDNLEMDPAALKDWLAGKGDTAAPTLGQAGGLLEAERSGKNRTDVVDTLCKHLGIKSPYEVTDAGPGYTNDVSRNVVKRG